MEPLVLHPVMHLPGSVDEHASHASHTPDDDAQRRSSVLATTSVMVPLTASIASDSELQALSTFVPATARPDSAVQLSEAAVADVPSARRQLMKAESSFLPADARVDEVLGTAPPTPREPAGALSCLVLLRGSGVCLMDTRPATERLFRSDQLGVMLATLYATLAGSSR
jgi:hypothetical protein